MRLISFVLLIILLSSAKSFAQLSGHNLIEGQFGKIPTDTVDNFPTVYDRLVLNYDYKKWKTGLTLEQFWSPYDDRNYIRVTQARLQYFAKNFEFKLGNFYETIGRGTLLRSFEIPGAVLEDITFRSRNYFNRDVVGAFANYRLKKFTFTGIYGSPLNNVLPPNQPVSERRSDRIGALSVNYQAGKHTVGVTGMNLTNEVEDDWYAMINASGKIAKPLSYYTEISRNVSEGNVFSFDTDASYALYGNLNFTKGSFGLTAEYKYYNNFVLGAGINEPPAVVKQHTYRTLNRSTHVLNPVNESGYQLEGYYYFKSGSVLTLNVTQAVNNFGTMFTFQELFAEYDFFIGQHNIKVFADLAQDPFKLESDRVSTGAYIDWKIGKKSGLSTEYEYQTFEREGSSFENQILQISFNHTSKYSIGFIGEYSTDNFVIDEEFKFWLGATGKYKINNSNTLYFFAGERRGGPACNSGVCYEVLDFNGVEVRLTTRIK